jgi:hypothetical protein
MFQTGGLNPRSSIFALVISTHTDTKFGPPQYSVILPLHFESQLDNSLGVIASTMFPR